MSMNNESRAFVTEPIVVDIGKAVKQLEESPELAQQLNELAFGKFAADQLAARDALIEELVEALKLAGDVIESYHKSTGIDLGNASRMPFYKDTMGVIDAALAKSRGH